MSTFASHAISPYAIGDEQLITKRIRRWTAAFITFLVVSGLTAFPVQTELHALMKIQYALPEFIRWWLIRVTDAVDEVAARSPFLLYGYDWLAYAHIVIALFFTGVYKNPVQNAWVIRIGMIACLGIFILAFTCGQIRGIPFFWTLVDCSFGVFGLIPLWRMHRLMQQLRALKNEDHF
jgi:hypothetical protein